ncbi:MAG: hypothetical protein SGPRY_010496, partial [Prymnesium sp.]
TAFDLCPSLPRSRDEIPLCCHDLCGLPRFVRPGLLSVRSHTRHERPPVSAPQLGRQAALSTQAPTKKRIESLNEAMHVTTSSIGDFSVAYLHVPSSKHSRAALIPLGSLSQVGCGVLRCDRSGERERAAGRASDNSLSHGF